MLHNATGSNNTANGYDALANYPAATGNTAVGYQALQGSMVLSANTGSGNTASGLSALQNNSAGSNNTASGYQALEINTSGSGNTAAGASALMSNTVGGANTAIGEFALQNNTTGSSNIAIGFSTATNVSPGNSNNIHIASQGFAADNGTIRIGNPFLQTSFFVAGVNNVNLSSDANAVPVVIDTSTGQLGVVSSFPQAITGVLAGTDLTGGGTSGTVTLNLDTTKVPTLAGANNFTGSANVFTGSVGVGTMSPGSTLDVNGNINFAGSVLYQGIPALRLPPGSTPPNAPSILFGNNISLGILALASNTTGFDNTAMGEGALQANTTGNFNTAIGFQALQNSSGYDNTAIGIMALQSNTTGTDNTAIGALALKYNASQDNTAIGSQALEANTSGQRNTATGMYALYGNTGGSGNTANGYEALDQNTAGGGNIAIGYQAGYSVTGSNNIEIGSAGTSSDSGTIRIGSSVLSGALGFGIQTSFFAAGIVGVTTGNNDAIPVVIDSAGQLGTVSSSRRYKEDIEDMGEASRDLMRLRPVTFRYKKAFADGSKPVQYGLIAEEVDDVYPDLVAHSADGQIETVKYQVLDSMLLNEVQKQNRHAEQQDETIRRQQELAVQQQEQIRRLEARLAALEGLLSGKGAGTAGR
jgi:hypothetical protein